MQYRRETAPDDLSDFCRKVCRGIGSGCRKDDQFARFADNNDGIADARNLAHDDLELGWFHSSSVDLELASLPADHLHQSA